MCVCVCGGGQAFATHLIWSTRRKYRQVVVVQRLVVEITLMSLYGGAEVVA